MTPGRLCIVPGTPCATCASGSRIVPESRAFMLADNSSLNFTSQYSAASTLLTTLITAFAVSLRLPSLPGTLSIHSFQTYPGPPKFLGALCPQYTLSSSLFPA